MSSCNNNPRSNFCNPHSEFNCHNKLHAGILGIFTPQEIAVGTHFHARQGTKTTPVVWPVEGEIWVSLSGNPVQPKNTYSCVVKVTDLA